jgi:hypothetical protein
VLPREYKPEPELDAAGGNFHSSGFLLEFGVGSPDHVIAADESAQRGR